MIIELATARDNNKIKRLDGHIPPFRLAECISNGQVYVLKDDPVEESGQNNGVKAGVIGVLRYSFFWQTVPFLDLLYIDENYRDQGYGTAMMQRWENVMKQMGYRHVMTSTQSDESAWRFYEKIGYRRIGAFLPPEQDAEEWMYLKKLSKITEKKNNRGCK